MTFALPESVVDHVALVRADNPGPMTLDGTNTYLLRAPGSQQVVVVDPGPDLPAHIDRVWGRATAHAGRLTRILLTHAHPDHEDAAPELGRRAGVRAESLLGGQLSDQQEIHGDGFHLRVVATPGHTPDSVTFVLRVRDEQGRERAALLTGDTVLGRGSTLINHPEGRLRDYLRSLKRLREVADAYPGAVLLPGHAAPNGNAAASIDDGLRHRADRLEQVRAAVQAGAGWDPDAVTRAVYADQPAEVQAAARRSVEAQLAYLEEELRGN